MKDETILIAIGLICLTLLVALKVVHWAVLLVVAGLLLM